MADPYWERFCTPLARGILSMIERGVGAPSGAPFILEENIEAVLADGRYRVGGVALRTKGKAKLAVGQRVHVFWRHGVRERILTHHWKRGQGGGFLPVANALMEELYIVGAVGAKEVWFRNHAIAVSLDLRALLGADPDQVGWGAKDSAFFVRAGTIYFTFRFDRPTPGAALTEPPSPDLVRAEHAWENTPLLAYLTWTYSDAFVTPSWKSTREEVEDLFAEDFNPATPTRHYTLDIATSLAPTLTRTHSGAHAQGVYLTEAAVTGGHVRVMHATLDVDDKLVLSLRITFGQGIVTGLPVVTVAGLANTDSCSTLSQATLGAANEIVSGAFGRRTSGPAAPDPDWHACVLNVTDSVVLWRSWEFAPSFTQARSALPSNALGLVSQAHEVHTSDWDPASDTDVTTCLAPSPPTTANTFLNRTTLPPDATHGYVDMGSLGAYVNDELGMVDLAALWFLDLPTLRATATAALVRYSNNAPYGEWHDEQTSYEGLPMDSTHSHTNLALRATLGGTNSYRACFVALEPLVYEATTQNLVLFATQERYDSEGTVIGVARSVWRVHCPSGAVVEILPWVEEVKYGIFWADTQIRVLGLSTSFVLWLRSSKIASNTRRWSVLLTHAVPGELTGGTSTVLQVDQTGTAMPTAIQSFIAEHTIPLVPEVMWYPTGTGAGTEAFLNAWDGTTPTLVKDGTYPPVRTEVPVEITALVDYTPGAAPPWTLTNPSSFMFQPVVWPLAWHVLDNADLRAQYNLGS